MRRIVTFSSAALFIGFGACGDSGGGKVAGDATTSTSTNDTSATTSNDTSATTTTTTSPDTSVAQDTTVVQQDVIDDTAGPDNGEGLCMGISSCVFSDCASATSQDEFNNCVQTCASAAESQDEVTAFGDYFDCQIGCLPDLPAGTDPTPEQEKGIYQCLLDGCIDADITCQGGTEFGTKNCIQLNGCLTACGSDGTPACLRDCFAASTEDAGRTYISLNYCVFSQCADKDGADFNNCATAAQANPPCVTYVNQCRGNSGAAPSAGGAGGASGAFDPGSFEAMKAEMGKRASRFAR